MDLLNKIKRIDYLRLGSHLLFWILLTVVYDYFSAIKGENNFWNLLVYDLKFWTPAQLIAVYFTLYVLITHFLLKRKYIKFVIFSILFFAILIFVIALPLQYYGLFVEYRDDYLMAGKTFPNLIGYISHNMMSVTTLTFMIVGIASSIKIAKVWIQTQQRQQNLLKEKFEVNIQLKDAELKYLKSQMNPHFLFNALNNLYSLTLEKSDKAPEVVLKISSILDYVLYECNVPMIDFDREVENIRNYIDLQKIRYGEETDITLDISGNTSDVQIAPLLILPLIENAFKHGLDKNVGKGYIYIDINITDDDQLRLTVKNSLKGENNNESGGIGLINLRKRLDLQYPEKHTFNIDINDNSCNSDLKVDLSP